MADVYRPDVSERLPVLVHRTPYDKSVSAFTNVPVDVLRVVRAGYVVVVQDTRGRGVSGGLFTPFVDEAADGEDTIGWAAGQPWSNGRVGMFGQSYVGATQLLAATRSPEALGAIAPVLTSGDYHGGWVYRGGAFELGFCLLWTLMFLAPAEIGRRGMGDISQLVTAVDAVDDVYRRMPLDDVSELEGVAPFYFDWLARPDDGDEWRRIAPARAYEQITAPALNVGGWYDLFLSGTLANYQGLRARAGSAEARAAQRLIVGPWAHGVAGGAFVERGYGLAASTDAIDLTGLHLEWFDQHLKASISQEQKKPVLLFVMGANVWREEDDWPLPDTRFTAYHLRSGGHANSVGGDGGLSLEPPTDEPADCYHYDPRDPVPTFGGATFLPGVWVGANAGPRDQRMVESRSDVLCYSTVPLERPLEVVGPVGLVLFASSSARDTDFVGKLVDVAPDGRAEILTDGILRARYRESLSEPSLLEPGRVVELHVDLGATAYRFPAGHRIRLDVTSSNFPRFDRNTNTGGVIAQERIEDAVVARNCVHHERTYPSRLILPVIERD
jgi:putative CocE/NonD family hydrolase